jgi:hypothetical protein
MWNRQYPAARTNTGNGSETVCRHRDFDDDRDEDDNASYRPKIDPEERDDFDEWRRERGSRGRKPKTGKRYRHRGEDEHWPES